MTIQEAIKRGTESLGDNINSYVLPDKQALQILIEAGTRILETREDLRPEYLELLPGETKE